MLVLPVRVEMAAHDVEKKGVRPDPRSCATSLFVESSVIVVAFGSFGDPDHTSPARPRPMLQQHCIAIVK